MATNTTTTSAPAAARPTITLPATTTRSRPRPTGDEEATSTLHLGEEFDSVPSMSLSEARMVINAVMEGRRKVALDRGVPGGAIRETETLIKTQQYLETFSRFKVKENIEAMERLLNAVEGLEKFERSQLASLCPGNAEEAKALIPSLSSKIGDAELDSICLEVSTLRDMDLS